MARGSGEADLAKKIESHLGNYEIYYELLSCRRSRMEIDEMYADLNTGKYPKGKKGEEMRQELLLGINLRLTRLAESYLYLRMTGPKGAGGLAMVLESECSEIEATCNEFKMDGELPALLGIVEDLKNGSMTDDWKSALKLIAKGVVPDFSDRDRQKDVSKGEQDAVARIGNAFNYLQRYPVLHGYFAQWAETQDARWLAPAMKNLARLPEGEALNETLGASMDWLSAMDAIYGKKAHGLPGEAELGKALESEMDKLPADAAELSKDSTKMLAFMRRLTALAGAVGRLSQLEEAEPVEREKLKEWTSGRLADAARTLYDVTKTSEKTSAATYWQAIGAWHQIYVSLPQGLREGILGRLNEKERDFIESSMASQYAMNLAKK